MKRVLPGMLFTGLVGILCACATPPADQPPAAGATADCAAGAGLEAADCRIRLGDAAQRDDHGAEALAQYQQALEAVHAAGDRAREAQVLAKIGAVYSIVGPYPKALEAQQQALALYRALGDRHGELGDLNSIGDTNLKLGQMDASADAYRQALAIAKDIGDHAGEAAAQGGIALLAQTQGHKDQANAAVEPALALDRQIGDRVGEARDLETLGKVDNSSAKYDQSLEHLQQALTIAREIGDRNREMHVRNTTAVIYTNSGKFARGIEENQQALDLARALGDRGFEARILAYLGYGQDQVGEHDKALENELQGLKIAGEVGDRSTQLRLLSFLGGTYSKLGRYAQALDYAQQGSALAAELNSPMFQTVNFFQIAGTNKALGQQRKALDTYEQLLAFVRKTGAGGRRNECAILGNISDSQIQLGDYPAALDFGQQALAMARELGSPEIEGVALNNIGQAYDGLGLHARALTTLQQALAIFQKIDDRDDEAGVLDALARNSQARRHPAEALDQFAQALLLADEVKNPKIQWSVRDGLRDTLHALHRDDEAIYWGKQAVNFIQGMRQSASTLDRDVQHSLVNSKQDSYLRLSNLLIDHGRLMEAEQVLAMLKQEEYFDFVKRDAAQDPRQTSAACDVQEKPWCERYAKIQEQVAGLGREYGELAAIAPDKRTPEQQQRYTELQQDLTATRQEFSDFLKQLSAEFAQAGAGHELAGYADEVLKSLRAEQGDLRAMGHGAVIVHYLVTPQRLRILLTTPEIQKHVDAPIGETELNRRIAMFRKVVQNSDADPRPAAQALYQVLIQPIDKDLEQAGAQTLMLSLPGALRYVSFAALHDGKHWLAERYAVVLYTEAARGHLNDKPQGGWQVAALGMSQEAPGFPALVSVPKELDGIVEDTQRSHGVVPGVERLNQDFTAAELTRLLEAGRDDPASHYPVFHVASHFAFVPGDDSSSYLLLGDGSQLSLSDFAAGAYPLDGVELLTLSACETGVGSGGDGREVDGLGAVAQNDGAHSVMATLWAVADASTGAFMQDFYRLHEGQQLTKAGALRQAQLAFIQNSQAGEGAGSYAHPYYWAPFILMGNWL